MVKVGTTNQSEDKADQPRKVTVGELVLRKVEQDGAKWETVFKDFEQSAHIKVLQETLSKAREFGERLNSDPYLRGAIRSMEEMRKQYAEPMRRMQEQMERIRKMADVSFPPSFVQTVEEWRRASKELIEREQAYLETQRQEITLPPPPAVVFRERFDRLETRLEQVVEQVLKVKFDDFVKQAKMPGIKNANCYCPYCGDLLMKVKEMSHFMEATMKCGNCHELLNLPGDAIIKP